MTVDLFGAEEVPTVPEESSRKRNAAPAEATPPPFEEAFARLEALVSEMERGDQPLEALLSKFEEGVKLVRHCQEFLKQAQLRVEQYVEQKDGHWVLKDIT